MGTKNNPGTYDCYENADPDEPMFVLLARDPLAPSLVREWADRRAESRGHDAKVDEAYDCAEAMNRWFGGLCGNPESAASDPPRTEPRPPTDPEASVSTTDSKAWWVERQQRLRKAAEEMSAAHFAQADATIPDLEFNTPDCPICLDNTQFDDGVFICDVCHISWPRNGYGRDAERYEA